MGRQWGEHCAVRLNFIKRAGDKSIKSTQPIESNRRVETTALHFYGDGRLPRRMASQGCLHVAMLISTETLNFIKKGELI